MIRRSVGWASAPNRIALIRQKTAEVCASPVFRISNGSGFRIMMRSASPTKLWSGSWSVMIWCRSCYHWLIALA